MDSKLVVFILSLAMLYCLVKNLPQNDNLENIDDVLSKITEEQLNEGPTEPQPVQSVNIGNALNRRTSDSAIFNTRSNNTIQQRSSRGGIKINDMQGRMRGGAAWGRAGPDEDSLIKDADVQPKYLYGVRKHRIRSSFKDHYAADPHFGTEDVSSSSVQERYRHMNTALSQLSNAKANSYKHNIDLDRGVDKEILVYSNSKMISPGFSAGFLENREPVQLGDGIPVNRDVPPDVNLGVQQFKAETVDQIDNKLIYKIN